MSTNEIRIKSSIMHVLNNKSSIIVLSSALLEKGSDFYDYVKKHIARLLNRDDVKICEFQNESQVLKLLQNSDLNFVELTRQIADHLYQIMESNIDIPPANLLILETECDGQDYIAILKLDYEPSYTHKIAHADDGEITDFIIQECVIPAGNKRLRESVLINMNDFTLRLVEKKHNINGSKMNYFSSLFLKCQTQLSNKVKINILQQAINKINSTYYYDDNSKILEEKAIIAEILEEEGKLEISKLPEMLFKDKDEEKKVFQENMRKYRIQDAVIVPKEDNVKKKITMHKIETDSGIIIRIPMDQYRNTHNIIFRIEEDGSKELTIKNINQINNK